ncbi:FGGY-family carbohydrate kinase [Pseudoclavibacter endophyticus]|uniref:FGGY-family carbohydrate kinase n=1 Tax=Pseudoclavibacter endophyticus TaxID=1778590 RepID=UPI001CE497CD|nr:FGGY-family carbohydrate kinase [Pseudoclavibacter endophyticus]
MSRGDDAGSGSGGPLLLSIDNGSQSTKVTIVDAAGGVVARGRASLRPPEHPAPGRVEHPDDDLWDSIVDACRQAMAAYGGDPSRIVAAGLCTIRFCRVLLDASGALAAPVISWMDERLARPYEHRDDRVAYVSTSTGYIAGRLTGRLTDAAGNTEGRWPVDHDAWRWSADDAVIASEGLRREQLLPLLLPGELHGRVTAAAAAASGLPEGLPVYATSNDKAVEALGSGLLDGGELLLSLGTYVATMTPGERDFAPQRVQGVWRNFGAVPGGTYYESAGVRRGMWTVSWLRDLVLGPRAGETAAPLGGADGERERVLDAEAMDAPPGAGGLVTVLDWLAPPDEPWRRGAMVGFDGSQGRGHLYRSVLEALALTTADAATELLRELGRTPRALIVAGGGARSDLMLRILAATYGVPVRRTRFADGAGMGAAIAAAVGAGVHETWDDAVDAMVHVADVVEPEPALVEAYRDIAARHRAIRAGVRGMLDDMAHRGSGPGLGKELETDG